MMKMILPLMAFLYILCPLSFFFVLKAQQKNPFETINVLYQTNLILHLLKCNKILFGWKKDKISNHFLQLAINSLFFSI